ncbi:colicin immunity domain-containing protein [Campylobacter sputorum]|uniref:colicin immunity domain-containing protein n=1 Tax=Campylobacter sputorum TaxID=206 RepID=UPI00053BE070|nr:colicin immunity domain-containing protein [Campylobacter sputorum]
MIYNNFLDLMRDFIDDKIDANTYQTYFFKLLHEDIFFDKHYDVMQNLFYDVEEYCADKNLKGDNEIDENKLKNSTIHALKLLLKENLNERDLKIARDIIDDINKVLRDE